MPSYESRRITISYLAAQELCEIFGLPHDVPSQALGAAVEKLIFKNGNMSPTLSKVEPQTQSAQPNKSALAAMLKNQKTEAA